MTLTKVIEEWLKVIEGDWKNALVDDPKNCQYPISLGKWHPNGYTDCDESATRWLWWGEHNNGMYVCKEHFQEIEEMERTEEGAKSL